MNETQKIYKEHKLKLPPGSFIRVRQDLAHSKAGRDGMVTGNTSAGPGLIFVFDRHNQAQKCECVGTEQWSPNELDYATLELPKDTEKFDPFNL
jgi:hypothetical protein